MCNLGEELLEKGRQDGMIDVLKTIIKKHHYTVEQALEFINIPKSKWRAYEKLLQN